MKVSAILLVVASLTAVDMCQGVSFREKASSITNSIITGAANIFGVPKKKDAASGNGNGVTQVQKGDEVAGTTVNPRNDNPPTNPPTNSPANPPTNSPANPPTNPPTNSPANPPTNSPANPPANPPTNSPANPPTNSPANPDGDDNKPKPEGDDNKTEGDVETQTEEVVEESSASSLVPSIMAATFGVLTYLAM